MPRQTVLIRGLFRGKYHWGTILEKLNARFPEREFLCLDIPGAGDRHQERSPWRIEEMVDSLRAQRNGNEPVDLIAISMGGMIGLDWAERYPNEVSSLFCINTTARGFSPFYQRLRPDNYLNILRALCAPPQRRARIIYSIVANRPMDDDVIAQWSALEQRLPMQPMNFIRQLAAALRFKAQQPQCRLMFVSSLHDKLVSTLATQALAKAWQSPLILNPQDGHDIPLDNPEWLIEQLVHWYQQV
ncbi:alpha/beta fold hydrolase [Vibrio fluvialis]